MRHTEAPKTISSSMTLTDRQWTMLERVARGEGFDPDLEPELDRLEEAGLLEIHFKHRDPETGEFDHIVALLTRNGWRLVEQAKRAAAKTLDDPGRQAG